MNNITAVGMMSVFHPITSLSTAVICVFVVLVPPRTATAADSFFECTQYDNPPEIRIDQCSKYINGATSNDETLAIAYNNRGVANRELGRLQGAIADYAFGLSLSQTDKQRATIITNRATAYTDMEAFDLAAQDFTTALKLDRANHQIYSLRADMYASMGKYTESIADLTAVIISVPEPSVYLYRRGFAYVQLGDCERAKKDLLSTIKMDSTQPLAYYYLAQCQFQAGDIDGSLRNLELASRYKEKNQDFIDEQIDLIKRQKRTAQ